MSDQHVRVDISGWWAVVSDAGVALAVFPNRRQADGWARSWATWVGSDSEPATYEVWGGEAGTP